MKDRSQDQLEKQLANIVLELRLIRRVLVFIAVGAAIVVGLLLDADVTVALSLLGVALYLVVRIFAAIVQRKQRKKIEVARLRELSGR